MRYTRVAVAASIKAALTLRNPKHYLFFARTLDGKRAATDCMARLKERTEDRDKRISLQAMRAQLKSMHAAGVRAPHELGKIRQPVFVANGDRDVMVASSHSADIARASQTRSSRSTPTPVAVASISTTGSSSPRSSCFLES